MAFLASNEGRAPDTLRMLAIVGWAAVLTWALFHAAAGINVAYYERWPFWGDTASYLIRDFSILGSSDVSGWRGEALYYSLINPRDPIRTAFYALLRPEQILSVNGHLYFSALTAFLFFSTFSASVWTRTRSIFYAMGAPCITLLFLGLWSPMYGMPSHLPDLPAAFLLGSALFALFIGRGSRGWLIFASGALLGLATLSRYHVWVYGIFLLGPIVTLKAVEQFLRSGRSVRAFISPNLMFIAGLALIAGVFIIRSAAEVFYFYSVAGYGLDKTIVAALTTTGKKLVTQSLGVSALGALALIFCTYASIGWEYAKKPVWFDVVALLWAATAIPLLILLVMRVEDDISQTYFMLPGIALATVAPFCIPRQTSMSQAIFRRFATGVAVVLPLYGYGFYVEGKTSETFLYPRPGLQQLYQFNRQVAELIAVNLPSDLMRLPVLDSNFDYYARYIIPTMQYSFGKRAVFGNVFQIRQSQWQVRSALPEDGSKGPRFSGELEADRQLIMPEIDSRVDVFMVLSDPYAPEASDLTKDDYTRALAAEVASRMKGENVSWRLGGRIASPFGSDVLIYVKRELQQQSTGVQGGSDVGDQ